MAVHTHRDVRQLLSQLDGVRIHRGSEIPIRAFRRADIDAVAALIERRTSMAVSVTGADIVLSIGTDTQTLVYEEHRLSS